MNTISVSLEPESYIFSTPEHQVEWTAFSRSILEKIKKYGLVSNFIGINSDELGRQLMHMQELERKFNAYEEETESVSSLTVRETLAGLLDRKDYKDLVKEFREEQSLNYSGSYDQERMAEIRAKQSMPFHVLPDEEHPDSIRFALVDISASDDQLISDFVRWLSVQRESYPARVPEESFGKKDFDEWRRVGILPYFDLQTIATLEGATITYEAIGNALFPDELDVTISERIRKVTRKKARVVMSWPTLHVLEKQSEGKRSRLL